MEKVGVRELKTHASEIVRRVREEHRSFELTYRGETIGKIIPSKPEVSRETAQKSWHDWQSFFSEVSEEAVDDATLDETMDEIRRTP